ncbi:MAG: type I deoxyribonuclease HsdR [Chitinophagales bacterium]|nr:MAG: type I deoxyribonuclease HsdR [Chitinophagales bacterium]
MKDKHRQQPRVKRLLLLLRQQKVKNLADFISQNVSIAPLAVFRILFGAVMLMSIIRFALNGWIETQFIQPTFYFPYYGFDWVQPLGKPGTYLLFTVMGISACMIMLGWYYKLFSVLFFLTFTYAELIDKTNYLNHYYFISILSFLLILLPVHRSFSLDVLRQPHIRLPHVPRWMILTLQLQVGMVYFFAGIAKLNPDWLFDALPLKIWLPARSDIPVIGWLFDYLWVAYAMSWMGALYDLLIPFLLAFRKTRSAAYLLVIIFHLMTGMLFQIGMFPYIMILLTTIFFSPTFHEKFIQALQALIPQGIKTASEPGKCIPAVGANDQATAGSYLLRTKVVKVILLGHFFIQVLLPFRYLLYPGHLFWTEEGYRFSWRVMLMEKAGTVFFYVTDPDTGTTDEVDPSDYLTPQQEKMMSTQPDMILQFAHYLAEVYRKKGIRNPEVRAHSYVSLNGRGSRPYINPRVNLAAEKESFKPKSWILPFEEDENKGIARYE